MRFNSLMGETIMKNSKLKSTKKNNKMNLKAVSLASLSALTLSCTLGNTPQAMIKGPNGTIRFYGSNGSRVIQGGSSVSTSAVSRPTGQANTSVGIKVPNINKYLKPGTKPNIFKPGSGNSSTIVANPSITPSTGIGNSQTGGTLGRNPSMGSSGSNPNTGNSQTGGTLGRNPSMGSSGSNPNTSNSQTGGTLGRNPSMGSSGPNPNTGNSQTGGTLGRNPSMGSSGSNPNTQTNTENINTSTTKPKKKLTNKQKVGIIAGGTALGLGAIAGIGVGIGAATNGDKQNGGSNNNTQGPTRVPTPSKPKYSDRVIKSGMGVYYTDERAK